MSGPRVVISGIGVVSTFGVGRECFWHHVSRGISGTRAVTEFDVSTLQANLDILVRQKLTKPFDVNAMVWKP
jgi:3-oxoacyl-(acyl-carrier-protein) synthase